MCVWLGGFWADVGTGVLGLANAGAAVAAHALAPWAWWGCACGGHVLGHAGRRARYALALVVVATARRPCIRCALVRAGHTGRCGSLLPVGQLPARRGLLQLSLRQGPMHQLSLRQGPIQLALPQGPLLLCAVTLLCIVGWCWAFGGGRGAAGGCSCCDSCGGSVGFAMCILIGGGGRYAGGWGSTGVGGCVCCCGWLSGSGRALAVAVVMAAARRLGAG